MSGHFIHPAGVACLRRMGLYDALAALGAPAQRSMTLDFGPVVLRGVPEPAPDGTAEAFAPRRTGFDAMLAAEAAAAGAEVRHGVSFLAPVIEGGRVVGARVATATGVEETIRAGLVVGADGKRSRLARAVSAAAYGVNPATTCAYYTYWQGFDASEPRLMVRDRRFFVAVPTNDGLTFLAATWPVAEFRTVRADVGAAYRAATAEVPWIADRLGRARQAERFIGTADLDGYLKVPHGPGWALVGDAGYHKDPITAQGMTDALLHAELLAEAILAGRGAPERLDTALAAYHARRDALAQPLYGMTNDLARLAPPTADMAALIGALAENATETRRFLGLMAGTVTLADFFAPANLQRIVGGRAAA